MTGERPSAPMRVRPGEALASFRGPLALFVAFLIALNGVGAAIFISARQSVEQAAERSLTLEVRLKTHSLSRWAFERRQDAVATAEQIGIGPTLDDWLDAGARPGDPRAKRLRARLASPFAYGTYSGVLLAATDGHALLSATGGDATISE